MARRGRIPRPWFRKGTGMWCVTLEGKQIPLAKTKRDAVAAFARLLAEQGRPLRVDNPTVRDLVDLWLADRRRAVKQATMTNYERIGVSWKEFAGGLLAADLRPYHVQQWLDRRALSQSSRHLWISTVKAVTRWADDQGYLDRDPLARLKAPQITRRSPVTADQFARVLDAAGPELRQLLTLLALTGVRPGELASMTVEGADLVAGVAKVVGKTGERTVPLGSAACEVLRVVVGDRTAGPIWPGLTAPRIYWLARYAAKKAGVERFSPHRIRGLFATEAIRRGVDSLLVSALLGHRDSSIVARHYASPDAAMLRDAAERATKSD